MPRTACALVWLTFLGLALPFDPHSIDPLAIRCPIALAGLLAIDALLLLRPPALRFTTADRVVVATFVATAGLCGFSPAPHAAFDRLVVATVAAQAYVVGRLAPPGLVPPLARTALGLVLLAGLLVPYRWMRPAGASLDVHVPTSALVSTFSNPDYLAGWLLVTTPLAAVGRSGPPFGLIGLVAIGWTLSRGAWISLAIALLLFIFMRPRRSPPGKCDRPSTRRLAVGVGLCALAGGFLLAGPEGRAKLFDPATFIKRLGLWSCSARLVQEAPLAGHGPGRFGEVYARVRPTDLPVSTAWAHNVFLHAAVETGAIGSAFLLGLVGVLLWSIRKALTTAVDPPVTEADAAAFGVAAFVIHNQASVTAFILPDAAMAGLASGLLVRAIEPGDRDERVDRRPVVATLAVCLLANLAFLPASVTRSRANHLAGQARALALAGKFSSALPLARQAVEVWPSGTLARDYLAGTLAETGHPLPSLVHYLVLETLDPSLGVQEFNRARVQLDLGRPRPALAELERFLATSPRSIKGLYAQAEAFYLLGRIDRSREIVAKARALATDDPGLAMQLDRLAAELARTRRPDAPADRPSPSPAR